MIRPPRSLPALIACLSLVLQGVSVPALAQDKDPVLKAMRDELDRSRMLRVASTDPIYSIEYNLEDEDSLAINASLGGLLYMNHAPLKLLTVKVRLGDMKFDNTNYLFSGAGSQDLLPEETSYQAVRREVWLATDRAFKAAEEAIGRKRSALKNVVQVDNLPDFSAAPPLQFVKPVRRVPVDENLWKNRVVKLSSIFAGYPQIIGSGLEFNTIQGTDYLVNLEGSVVRYPEDLTFLRVKAFAQAPDGMGLTDGDAFQSLDLASFPNEADLKSGITALAAELTALTHAPIGESYDGPVLFEPKAAAQLFAQVLGGNLKVTRKPLGEPGRAVPHMPTELETKVGNRILPEWIDVTDEPTLTEWHGQKLFGQYAVDMEGVKPQPVKLVEKGVLRNLLLTRTPVLKNFEASNGHARMRSGYGATSPDFSNLFIHASQTVSAAELKNQLIALCKERNKPYGLLVRKLDFPSAMSTDDARRVLTAAAQGGGGGRPVSPPVLVYRVYPDGREELVRGVLFHGISVRSLRDIRAASDQSFVLSFMDSPAAFALMGANGYITNASVVAPGVLFEEMELERMQDDLPKLPVVPPPTLQ